MTISNPNISTTNQIVPCLLTTSDPILDATARQDSRYCLMITIPRFAAHGENYQRYSGLND